LVKENSWTNNNLKTSKNDSPLTTEKENNKWQILSSTQALANSKTY
jgi:hypothetical protein